MITEKRLTEIEESPREAYIFKTEAKELATAYRMAASGLTIEKRPDGIWLRIKSPSGKEATINMEALGIQRGGIVGATVLEWADALGGVE